MCLKVQALLAFFSKLSTSKCFLNSHHQTLLSARSILLCKFTLKNASTSRSNHFKSQVATGKKSKIKQTWVDKAQMFFWKICSGNKPNWRQHVVFKLTFAVEQRRESVSLIILAWPPQDHDDDEDDGEKEMPKRFIDPQVTPIWKIYFSLMSTLAQSLFVRTTPIYLWFKEAKFRQNVKNIFCN